MNEICPENYVYIFDFRNSSDEEISLLLPYSSIFIKQYILPPIVILGLMANLMFLLVIFRVQEMRTITNFYLANLAVSDFLFLFMQGFVDVMKMVTYGSKLQGEFYHTSTGCVIGDFLEYTPYFSSIGFVTLVVFERFLAICYPLKSRIISSRSRTAKLTISVWLTAFTLCLLRMLPIPIKNNLQIVCSLWPDRDMFKRLPHEIRFCSHTNFEFVKIYGFVEILPFLIGVTSGIMFSSMIIHKLFQPTPGYSNSVLNQAANNRQRMRTQVARMLIVNAIVFFVCMTPFQIANFFWVLSDYSSLTFRFWTKDIQIFLNRLGVVMTLCNSAVNPLIYTATNQRYRDSFKQAFALAN